MLKQAARHAGDYQHVDWVCAASESGVVGDIGWFGGFMRAASFVQKMNSVINRSETGGQIYQTHHFCWSLN